MSRRGWDDLSSSYRARLERGGITRAAYGRGESLSGARGHAATPERPERAESKPEYTAYRELRKEIQELRREVYGSSPRFRGRSGDLKGKSQATLKKAAFALERMANAHMDLDTFRMMYPEYDSDEWDWLGYYH